MRLAFIDIAAAYDSAAPQKGPVGGTQGAVCHLARALAAADHDVALINQKREEGDSGGVKNISPDRLDEKNLLESFDAVILNGRWTDKVVRLLRGKTRAPLVGWMHEAAFNAPWALPLPEFSAFVFVSVWQATLNAPLVPQAAKTAVIKNGVGPAFHGLFAPGESISAAKAQPPVLAYVGSKRRGLYALPDILPPLVAARPDLRFALYADFSPSADDGESAAFLQKLPQLPHIIHKGAVPQAELTAGLKRASYILSPNTYPETFCIALAEGMAAGCVPIITARAALPETAAGFATLVPVEEKDSPEYRPGTLNAGAFVSVTLETLAAHEALNENMREEKLQAQIAFADQHYNWATHAHTWANFLKTL